MSTDLVFFLHRLGVKIYRVTSNLETTEVVDIPTLDIPEAISKLTSFSGKSFRLLISDTISYIFHTHIPVTNIPISRDIVLEKIKNEIPENFASTNWDYKIINTSNDTADILVFALVSDFQNFINQISDNLQITFEATEPESVAVTRHPDPVVGIFKKDDLKNKDEQSLNLTFKPENISKSPNIIKPLLIIVLIILFVVGNYFLYQWYQKNNQPKITKVSTPSITPTSVPVTPTVPPLKQFIDLTLSIQNGSGKTGYASQVATKFTTAGLKDIVTGNADNSNYQQSKLIFKDETIKLTYQTKFTEIFPITVENISIDKTQVYDALLILGTN